MKEARVQVSRFSSIRFVIGIVSVFVSIGLVRSIVNHWQKGSVVSERQEALEAEQKRNRDLTVKFAEATSAAFIEKEAREKLGLVREGDTVVLLDTSQNPQLNGQAKPDDIPNWKKWWRLFF